MITLMINHLNTELTQDLYDSYIHELDLHHLPCTCSHHDMVRYGTYQRNVITASTRFHLTVVRLLCKECGRTHAVLPSSIVPWQYLQLGIQIQILSHPELNDDLMVNNPNIDEQLISRVKNNFKKKYKPWMHSEGLCFDDDLVSNAFLSFMSNFMQMHKGTYQLFSFST